MGVLTSAAPAAQPGVDVTLLEKGDCVVLDNGVLAAALSKSMASVTSLRFRGFEMLTAGYYSMDGGWSYRTPAGCRFFVKSQTPDVVDVGMRRVWRNEPQAFDIEIHYVLRRGDTGLYSYALLEHPTGYPATGVGEWRFVWKLPGDLLERICVDRQRTWTMQSPRDRYERTPIKEIIKLTSGVRAGQFDCKYDFNANYSDLACWGHASNSSKIGAWIVLGSHEFFNDGPTKQDLTAAAGINHLHFGLNHYNGSVTTVKAGEAWSKIYGPFLLYCNYDERGANACWADARERGARDRMAWPHAWLTNQPAYPPASGRGGVAGRFRLRDPLKPALGGGGAWIGLARPPPGGNWQFDSMSYQHWTKTDPDGRFEISDARPGTYTLYAFADGAVEEYSRAGVAVDAGRTAELGDIVWEVPRRGTRIAWEIGVPDRTAKEFRNGADYFHGYLWERIPKEFSNPLDYFIGRSVASNDWNYAQARYPAPRGGYAPHTWRIHFALPEAPRGESTLTLAIASATLARIAVFVNDELRPLSEVAPAVQGGNALLREGIHAKYCVEYVAIPAGRLRAGDNIIALALIRPKSPESHVMYDYLSLELP